MTLKKFRRLIEMTSRIKTRTIKRKLNQKYLKKYAAFLENNIQTLINTEHARMHACIVFLIGCIKKICKMHGVALDN